MRAFGSLGGGRLSRLFRNVQDEGKIGGTILVKKDAAEGLDPRSIEDGLRALHFSTGPLEGPARDLADAMQLENSQSDILERSRDAEDAPALWSRSSLLAALRAALLEIDALSEKLNMAGEELKQAAAVEVQLRSALAQSEQANIAEAANVASLRMQLEAAGEDHRALIEQRDAINAVRRGNFEKRKEILAKLKKEKQQVEKLKRQGGSLAKELAAARRQLNDTLNSSSWRLTKPLRALGRLGRS